MNLQLTTLGPIALAIAVVLLIVIFAQLILLAWQVKSDSDVPLVRVWAVTAVAPVASTIEGLRNGTTGFFSNYFELWNAREQSRQLRTEVDKLRLENQFLKNELGSAQRAGSLAGFQAHNLSKMIGARVIAATPGTGTRSVLIDRGYDEACRLEPYARVRSLGEAAEWILQLDAGGLR